MTTWWWASSFDSSIIFLAAGFGLGPRVAAEVLSKSIGRGMTEWKSGSQVDGLPKFCHVIFNFGVTDPVTGFIQARRKVWIDCLLWLRDSLPEAAMEYDIIVSESFFGPRLSRFPRRLIEVRPLLQEVQRGEVRLGSMLVSFGGVETPFTDDVHRFELPRAILIALARAVSLSEKGFCLTCFVPDSILELMKLESSLKGVSFEVLDRQRFVSALSTTEVYVVQPGLYGPFEAFSAGILTSLCMPMSYTQMWQAEALIQNGLLEPALIFEQIRNATEPTGRDVEKEEGEWFARLGNWWKESCCRRRDMEKALEDWALQVVSGQIPSRRVLDARKDYAASLLKLPTILDVVGEVAQR